MMREFLPISRDDMKKRGWDELDFVYVIGDAYVDHPSFGPAIISRVLEAHGYKVGIISQPDWKNDQSVMALGVPRLGFLVSAGNMDSMVNHYTVSKKRRHQDAFTPGGVYGKRPDYAAVVYGNMIRRACPDKPIIVGGIEASLRRLGHYDYWSNKIRRSLLIESSADLLLYGMNVQSLKWPMHWMEALKPRISHGLPVLFLRVKRPKILVKKLLCCRHLMKLPLISANMPKAFISSIRIQTHFPASE